MKPLFVLITALALAGCQPPAPIDGVDVLMADPVRLKALRQQCQADRAKAADVACQAAAEAFRRRFFAGMGGPDEYQTLADLPPIPPSFDAPVEVSP